MSLYLCRPVLIRERASSLREVIHRVRTYVRRSQHFAWGRANMQLPPSPGPHREGPLRGAVAEDVAETSKGPQVKPSHMKAALIVVSRQL